MAVTARASTLDTIVVACHRWDFPQARACVASIRYWYPQASIYLLKDESRHRFSTTEVERYFDVRLLPVSGKYNGYGTTKFEALFAPLDRYLLVDADTIFAGPVLDELAGFDDDFIVTGVWTGPGEHHEPEWLIKRDYIDAQAMQQIDPAWLPPPYGINSGHMVITNGRIDAAMIDRFVDFPRPRFKRQYAHVFPYGPHQGILNYIIPKLSQTGAATVRYVPFWLWPSSPRAEAITVDQLRSRTSPGLIVHWAGLNQFDRRNLVRYDLFRFFEDRYYERVPNAARVRAVRDARDGTMARVRRLKTIGRRLLKG